MRGTGGEEGGGIEVRIEIDNIWCKGCGLCVRACKKGVLAIGTERSKGGYLMPYAQPHVRADLPGRLHRSL